MLRLSRLPRLLNSINVGFIQLVSVILLISLLQVRYTTPGHANPFFLDRSSFIDPGHPAARLTLSKLPLFVSPRFTIRVFPNAVLREPVDFVPINPILATALVRARSPHKWWSNLHTSQCRAATDRTQRESPKRFNNGDTMRKHVGFLAARQIMDVRNSSLVQRGKRNLSLLFHTSKKNTSKSAVIRRRLRSKMSTAIALVIGRSADAVRPLPTARPASSPSAYHTRHSATTPPPLVYRPLSEGERFVLQGHSFSSLIHPVFDVYT